MIVQKSNTSILTKIVSAATWNKEFLKQFSRITKKSDSFNQGALGMVLKWCVQYYDEYQDPPKHHLSDVYEANIKAHRIKVEMIPELENILSLVMGDSKAEWNIPFLIEEAENLALVHELSLLKEDLDSAIAQEDLRRANELLNERRLRDASSQAKSVDPLSDDYAISCVFARSQESLFHLKGGLGQLLNPHLKRDSLLAILAPEKRGKTFLMMELCMRAVMARKNVVMFQVGDLSDYQFFRRMWMWMSSMAGDEMYADKERAVPVMDCVLNQNDTCVRAGRVSVGKSIIDPTTGLQIDDIPANYQPCIRCQMKEKDFDGTVLMTKQKSAPVLTEQDCYYWRNIFKQRMRGRKFKVACYPNSTVSVADLNAALNTWHERDNFIPDVIVLDYADILAPEDPKKDVRAQQDERWRALRRMSQEHNCLLVTATQAKRNSYTSMNVEADDQSEDKRKNAHLTGMIGLHQTAEEKNHGILRTGWIMLREGEWSLNNQAVLLQDLATGQPHVDSYLKHVTEPIFKSVKTDDDTPKKKGDAK